FFFSSRRRHTRLQGDWSSDVCSSDLPTTAPTPTRWKPGRSRFARCSGLPSHALTTHEALTGPQARSSPKIGPAAPDPRTREANRSEERRVGKEGRDRWSTNH